MTAPKTFAPIDKLKQAALERASKVDALVDRPAENKKVKASLKRDGMNAAEKRAYIKTFEPGGSRHYIIEEARACQTVPERIHYVAKLMTTGQWRSAMAMVLTEPWNCAPVSVQRYSTEASRVVENAIGDKDTMRATVMAFLETVAHDALENGDRRSAVTAARTFAEIAGLLKLTHEHVGPDGGPIQVQFKAVQQLSDADLKREIIKAAVVEVRKKQDRGEVLSTEEIALMEDTFQPLELPETIPIPDAETEPTA